MLNCCKLDYANVRPLPLQSIFSTEQFMRLEHLLMPRFLRTGWMISEDFSILNYTARRWVVKWMYLIIVNK